MSYRVIGLPTGAFEAHNWSHTQLADDVAGSFPHNDGTDYNEATPPVADTLTGGSPSTLARAVDVFNAAKALWHRHRDRYTSGRRLLAHKALDARAISAADMSSGATVEAAIVAAWGPICIDILTKLRGHMLNTGGTWHGSADLFNVVSVPASITTKTQLWEYTLLARAVYMDHIASSSGGAPHSSADTTNTIAAEPPDTADDLDKVKAVLAELGTDLVAHAADGGIHNTAQTIAAVTAPAYPADLFTMSIEFKTDFNGHCGDTTVHEVADSTNTLSYTNPTTIALLITAAQEAYVDLPAHIAFAPKSAALRTAP